MGNQGFIEIPRAFQSTRVVGRSSGGHYLLQNGRYIDAIESASRFHSAGEITAKSGMMFNLMTVSCQTFSLGHILIDYVFGAAIPIAHGDHNDGDEDSCDDVRRAAKSGDYCVAKTAPPM